MNRDSILYWLHRWHDAGIFNVDFEGCEEAGLIDDFVACKFENPVVFFGALNRAVSS